MNHTIDAVLEGVRRQDIDSLRLVSAGDTAAASADDLSRLEAKGWLQCMNGLHLITLTGRTLLDKPPVAAFD